MRRQDIYLPHINYTVKVRPFKPHPSLSSEANAWIDKVDRWHSIIYLRKKVLPPTIAHEVIHVLQHICYVRNMQFNGEEEHMGYIMQYLMGRILGYVWVTE